MCLFCRIAGRELSTELLVDDPDVLAFRDINPKAPTHILVIPRKHISSLARAEAGDVELLGKLMLTAQRVAHDAGLRESGYRVVVNTGAEAGQSVFHIHLHVLGGRSLRWPPG